MKIIYTKEDKEKFREWGRQGGSKGGKMLLKKYGKEYFKKISRIRLKKMKARQLLKTK